jgi:hypothetical protein
MFDSTEYGSDETGRFYEVEDGTYFCGKCRCNHRRNSNIGLEHGDYFEDLGADGDDC